jgi:hypothetical protein
VKTFQPRQVDSSAPWRWVREALALMARRPASYAGATLAIGVVFFAMMQADSLLLRFVLVLFLPPLSVLGCLRLAEAADKSSPFAPADMLPGNAEAIRVFMIALTGYCIVFAPLMLLAAGSQAAADAGVLGWQAHWESSAAGTGMSLQLLTHSLLLGASLAAFAGLLLGLGAWFALPLVSLQRMGLLQACLLSLSACRLNAASLRFTSFFALITVLLGVLASFGLLSLLLAPFFGAVLYVSYRDVFLGQAQNAALAAVAARAAAASS